MYAQSVVEQRLEFAKSELGFWPQYHSPADIDTFTENLERRFPDVYAEARAEAAGSDDPARTFQSRMLKALADPKNPKLTADDVRFMENERALVQCDAAYWLSRYYWIKNRQNMIQRFSFQGGQKILFNVIAELEAMGASIEILIAKARQLGMTTLVEGLMLLKAMFGEGVNGVLASADRDITKKMVKMVFLAYDRMPWWLRPITSRRVESDNGMIVFGGINAGLGFQHGKQTNPIAMGDTPVAYHLSEVSSYPNPEQLIDVGLFKAVHPSPRVLGFLESTCKGDTGWWHDSYWEAKEQWAARRSRVMGLFLPFYCAEDMYPNPTERLTHPVPEGWRPEDETRKMMAESALYVQSNPVLAKVLAQNGKPWEMNYDQAWYWERNFMSARRKGAEKNWYQEMPHTDTAAFQGSFDNVFGKEVIAEVFSDRETRYDVFGIVGQSIEDRHEPDPSEVDYDEPRIPIRYSSRKGETYRWELVPLHFEEPFVNLDEIRNFDSHMGKFFVWLPPERGYRYAIGIDTSAGTGNDGSVIAVNRLGRNPQERDEQAAEWRSNLVGHVEAYAWAMAIATYYSRYMGADGVRDREPLVAVEQVAAVGDTVQLQMRQMGYRNFFKPIRYDNAGKYMKKINAHKEGWFTTGITRPILTNTFVTLVQNNWYKVNSAYTMWEMDHWEVHLTGRGIDKFEHSQDSTDDGIFANAMAAFCPRDLEPLAERASTRWRGQTAAPGPKLDITPTNSGTMFATTSYSPPREKDLRRPLRYG